MLLRQSRPLVATSLRGAAFGVLRFMNTQPHVHPTPHKEHHHHPVTKKPTPTTPVGHPHGGKTTPPGHPTKPTAHHQKKHHKGKSTAPRVMLIEGIEIEWVPLLAKKLLIN